jgi:hypothetical protein
LLSGVLSTSVCGLLVLSIAFQFYDDGVIDTAKGMPEKKVSFLVRGSALVSATKRCSCCFKKNWQKNFQPLCGSMFFFACPKKNQKKAPEIENSPISGWFPDGALYYAQHPAGCGFNIWNPTLSFSYSIFLQALQNASSNKF